MRKNILKKFATVCLATVSMFVFSIPAFARSGTTDFGYTTAWYSSTARDYYAGIEMATDSPCDMSCRGSVCFEDIYGNMGTRILSAGNGCGYNCSASMRSYITTYWDMDASFEACNDDGDSFYDEINNVSE